MKWSEGLSKRVSVIIRCIDHTKFAAYMTVSLPRSFIFFGLHFVSLYIRLYVLYVSVQFCKLCILIVIFMYSYCYVRSVLGILFHCVVLCIVCM